MIVALSLKTTVIYYIIHNSYNNINNNNSNNIIVINILVCIGVSVFFRDKIKTNIEGVYRKGCLKL
jgi:hypothetical protein